MENSTAESLLHPKIAKFYEINEKVCDGTENLNYINQDVTYNWNNLEKLLLRSEQWSNNDPVYPKTYDDYMCYFQLLQPVLRASQVAIAQLETEGPNQITSWLHKCQWLGHQTQVSTTLQEHLCPSSQTSNLENVLFLTATLENALGNVYYSITMKAPPHLLRDLLDTKELKNVLGLSPILFLKIIMGSPDSVNLRNIVWHGFPLPSEVPSCYAATLLISAASLYALVEDKLIEFIPRLQVTDFSRFAAKIRAAPIDFTSLQDLQRMERAIDCSKWTGSNHKAFWFRILEHYRNERHWQFVVLILPQIELVLRRMYGEANAFDITAKLDEYYITMNTIFESKDNRLFTEGLGKGTLHLLYDIFISPYGMRIRDKVSHGEVDLNCINKDLCSILLYAGLNLITSNNGYPLDRYESRFHLNFLAFDCLTGSKICVLKMMTLKCPSNFGMDFNWSRNSIESLQELEIARPSEIFSRHKKEPEVVTMLMRIAQLVVQVSKNYEASFAERFQMFTNHELRSRARKTLDNMVKNMSVIGDTLEKILRCSVRLYNFLQSNGHEWLEGKFVETQRFFKQTLTILENFVRFSDRESNEWIKALDYCSRFQEISSQFMGR